MSSLSFKGISKRNLLFVLCGGVLFLLIVLLRPFDLSFAQALSIAAVVVALLFWATECIKSIYTSILLLLFFLIFSGIAPAKILNFPLSPNFYLVIASFLLSEGVSKSLLSNRIANFLLSYCKKPLHFVLTAFLLNFILLFLMPHPYARVIMLGSLFTAYLREKVLPDGTKRVIIFSVFVFATCCSMCFLNGDVLFNNTLMSLASANLTWGEWAKFMFVPSFLTSVVVFLVFPAAFRKELFLKPEEYDLHPSKKISGERHPFSRAEILSGGILFFVIAGWISQPLHHVPPAIIGAIGVILMILLKLLSFHDFRCINISIMVFVTAAFSIGAVLTGNGAGVKIFEFLSRYVSTDFLGNGGYNLLIVCLITMAFHMLLGSSLTTVSVVIPCMLSGGSSLSLSLLISFTAYATCMPHYILPFHHSTIMLGMGTGAGYKTSEVARYGLFMTFLILPIFACFYIPWWKFVGLIS